MNLQYNTHIKTRTKKLDHTNKTAATVLKFKYRILSSCYMQTEGATAVRCCYWKHTRTQAQQYIHRHTRPYVSRRHTDPVNICNVWQSYLTAQLRTEQCCTWETLHFTHGQHKGNIQPETLQEAAMSSTCISLPTSSILAPLKPKNYFSIQCSPISVTALLFERFPRLLPFDLLLRATCRWR